MFLEYSKEKFEDNILTFINKLLTFSLARPSPAQKSPQYCRFKQELTAAKEFQERSGAMHKLLQIRGDFPASSWFSHAHFPTPKTLGPPQKWRCGWFEMMDTIQGMIWRIILALRRSCCAHREGTSANDWFYWEFSRETLCLSMIFQSKTHKYILSLCVSIVFLALRNAGFSVAHFRHVDEEGCGFDWTFLRVTLSDN